MEDKIKRTSVVTEAMLRIKELIISDAYQVGDRVPTELELAQKFGIGRSSIREALKVFQYLGILETRVPKGTFLCKSSTVAAELITWFSILERKSVYEILELREVFEQRGVLNIVRAYQSDTHRAHDVVKKLELEVRHMERAIDTRHYEDIQRADFNFHHIIIQETGNSLFLAIFGLLHKFTRDEMLKTHENYTDIRKLVEEHSVIIEAIKTQDPLKALDVHSGHFPLIRKNFRLDEAEARGASS